MWRADKDVELTRQEVAQVISLARDAVLSRGSERLLAQSAEGLVPVMDKFQLRCETSLSKVIQCSKAIHKFFEDERQGSAKTYWVDVSIAVFAPGSLARLEAFKKPGPRSKDSESDLDLLCIVDGCDPTTNYWKNLYKRFINHLRTSIQVNNETGVLLDKHYDPPSGAFRKKEELVATNVDIKDWLKLIRDEDKRIEGWRYWVVFESVLLYSYSSNVSGECFATKLEDDLARGMFGMKQDMLSKWFPLLWYHSACRNMSGIYIDSIRDLEMERADPKETLCKIAKLKSARVLSWAFAVMNSLVLAQLLKNRLIQNDEESNIWSYARRPGLVPAFALQTVLRNTLNRYDRMAGRPMDLETAQVSCLSRNADELGEQEDNLETIRNVVLDSYSRYFEWLELDSDQQVAPNTTYDDSYKVLHGKHTDNLPISSELMTLVKGSSHVFHRMRKEFSQYAEFCPDHMFY